MTSPDISQVIFSA